jgi:hypothetical protein
MRARLLAAVLATQVAVPTAATLHGVPSRFGFHMYSGNEHLAVSARDRHGQQVDVDVPSLVAKVRYELDWSRILPDVICDHYPHARRVVVTSGEHTAGRRC